MDKSESNQNVQNEGAKDAAAAAGADDKPQDKGSPEGDAKDAKPKDGAVDEGTKDEGAKPAEKEQGQQQAVVPDSADKYDFTLPDVGLKDEKGDPFQFAADDPFVAEARDVFFKHKIPQSALTDLIGLYARINADTAKAGQTSAIAAEEDRRNAELKALATKDADGKEISGGQRVETLLNNVNKVLGDAGASKKLSSGLINAEVVKVVEALTSKLLSQPSGKPQAGAGSNTEGLRGAARLKAIRAAG